MSPKTFYSKLEKTKTKIKWTRSCEGNMLRGTIKQGMYKGEEVCPITAVGFIEGFEQFDPADAREVGEDLDLPDNFITDTIAGADNSINEIRNDMEDDYYGYSYQTIVKRKTLLKRLGFAVNDR